MGGSQGYYSRGHGGFHTPVLVRRAAGETGAGRGGSVPTQKPMAAGRRARTAVHLSKRGALSAFGGNQLDLQEAWPYAQSAQSRHASRSGACRGVQSPSGGHRQSQG